MTGKMYDIRFYFIFSIKFNNSSLNIKEKNMDDSVDLDIKKSLLRKQTCFFQFTEDEIEQLAALLVEKRFAANEVIVSEGEPVDSVYLIARGSADVRLATIKENAIETNSIATLNAGDAIGLNETGFYSLSGRRTATVIALTDTVTLRLNVAEFHGFALAYSHVNEVMRKNAEVVSGIKFDEI